MELSTDQLANLSFRTISGKKYSIEMPVIKTIGETKQALSNKYSESGFRSSRFVSDGQLLGDDFLISEIPSVSLTIVAQLHVPQASFQTRNSSKNKFISPESLKFQNHSPGPSLNPIGQLSQMGFSEEESTFALEAAGGNFSRAISILFGSEGDHSSPSPKRISKSSQNHTLPSSAFGRMARQYESLSQRQKEEVGRLANLADPEIALEIYFQTNNDEQIASEQIRSLFSS